MAGAKALTATSGPGFSLKQENLGLAYIAEIPIVVVDVMRGGPSTGAPTRTAQQSCRLAGVLTETMPLYVILLRRFRSALTWL